MYTGIIKKTALVRSKTTKHKVVDMVLSSKDLASGCEIGDSINVDGVCLTIVEVVDNHTLRFQLMPETLRRTTLGSLVVGRQLNMEASLRVGDKLGGHYVMGHVDGVGEVVRILKEGDSRVMRIKAPTKLLRYIPFKGSIAINGVSLTVSALHKNGFEVSLIPHTLKVTNLSKLRKGSRVNLEIDMMARYLERMC